MGWGARGKGNDRVVKEGLCKEPSCALTSPPSPQPQYVFLHDALLEALECGVTEVAARELRDQYRFLGTVDEIIGLTGLEIEYDKLESTVHRKATKTFGTLNINKAKNRYANIDMLPCKLCSFVSHVTHKIT